MRKTIEKIYIDLRDEQSIKKAESKKIRLENQGYNLINNDNGFLTACLTYKKGA